MLLTIIFAIISLMCNVDANTNSNNESQPTATKSADIEGDGGILREQQSLDSNSQDREKASDFAAIENQTELAAKPDTDLRKTQAEETKLESSEKSTNSNVADQHEFDEDGGHSAQGGLEASDGIKGQVIDASSVIPDKEVVDHSPFNTLLQQYVSSAGNVDYSGIKSNVSNLNDYIKLLQDNPVDANWSRNARLAYWINAYNAFTIKLIVDNFPVKSIMDLDGGKPWDKRWIKIGDESYSLNDIEHKIIRPKFGDARIHFAVNCAAKSCPPIANAAYTEDNVNELLEQRTIQFINDSNYNQIEDNQVRISKIFEWYKEDFGDLAIYLNKYLEKKINPSASIAFLEYNWDLNN